MHKNHVPPGNVTQCAELEILFSSGDACYGGCLVTIKTYRKETGGSLISPSFDEISLAVSCIKFM